MSKKSLNLSGAAKWYAENLKNVEQLPFTFEYDGTVYAGLSNLRTCQAITKTDAGEKIEVTADVDETLRVRAVIAYNEEFGQSEYTVYFDNPGKAPSRRLSNVYALDTHFEGTKPVLRGNLGDHDNYYAAYEHDLTKGDQYFLSTGGRATHIVFPYFDLVHGTGGTMLALGWAGTWECLFSYTAESGTRVRARTDVDLDTVLLPGESVRTGLMVFLPYNTRDYDDAANLWREWYMKYNLPKADAEGNPLKPFSTACFASDTGLPNSDGSISERYFTWQPTLKKLIDEDVVPDFRWFDAGWYFDPYGKTVPEKWWHNIGTWELDTEKWPGKSFLESNEACHKAGMKVLVWFEPERVTHVDGLVANYGYKEEWSIGTGESRTNDLGNPECLKWTLGRITDMLDKHGVDMYREDNNSDPAHDWPYKDEIETQKVGLPRYGITENKCICGHYALWDGIIAFCRENGKCPFLDSCASGGGRNDIESMRRAFPLMRSDYDRTTTAMRLSQSSTFPRWIPFHGSSIKETVNQLDAQSGAGSTPYIVRASYLPVYNYGEEFTHNKELDYDLMRSNYREWKSLRNLLTRDFYVLTPWHYSRNTDDWTAFAYDAPETGESVLLAFRMETAKESARIFKLKFVEDSSEYILKNADTGEEQKVKGAFLKNDGVRIELPEPKSSALIRIKKIEQ